MPKLEGLKPAQIDLQQPWSSPWTAAESDAGLTALSHLLLGHPALVSWLLLALEAGYQAGNNCCVPAAPGRSWGLWQEKKVYQHLLPREVGGESISSAESVVMKCSPSLKQDLSVLVT